MSRRKPLAALAAVMTAAAVAVPATSASADATAPSYVPPQRLCNQLSLSSQIMQFQGESTVVGLIGQTAPYVGCAAPDTTSRPFLGSFLVGPLS